MACASFWPHSLNVHRYCEDENKFYEQVCITLKVDGSNLTIHIKKIDGIWYVMELIGRNSVIWTNESATPITSLSYGSPGKLENLPLEMQNYAIRLGEYLKVEEIYISGEVYRMKDQRYASWHPFGYKIGSDDIIFMTSKTHQLFVEMQNFEIVTTSDQMNTILVNSTCHLIFPPPILYIGKLGDGILSLYTTMMKHDRNFEGCFIIWENGSWGFKWKTGLFEEQHKIPDLSEFSFTREESLVYYTKLIEVFNHRPHYEARERVLRSQDAKSKKNDEKELKELCKKELSNACEREMTKMESFNHIPRSERKTIVQNLIGLVVKEVKQVYEESKMTISWSDDELKSMAESIILQIVMKVPFYSKE